MDTSNLKKFAQYARRSLMDQVESRMQLVLEKESAARREYPKAIAELERQIANTSRSKVMEKVAYTWFNRFCALRFMDMNGYTTIRIVSPEDGQFQPAILAEAKMGHIDSKIVPEEIQKQVFALLDGTATSNDAQGEAYRLLLVAACNSYHRSMSYLFERIADYTELLIPADLLSNNSILSFVRQAMTPDACKDVEVLGWLYQFYISEKKDQVFEGLKKNKKITPENIPAATQLFTPHYIVRYLVENSLGRLWMLNNPDSRLIEKMDYYIKPVEAETDFLTITSPEELKICDPACGSGHMLSYAYDLLYAIYLEEGYDENEIPVKILTYNLYGIELDERAGELASFALSMKAAGGNPYDADTSNHGRFFRKPVKPNICILENVEIQPDELAEYMEFAGRDLFTAELQTTIRQFDEADNFGSLIRPACNKAAALREALAEKDLTGQLLLGEVHKNVLRALAQADYLSSRYHVVVANPPYMGGKGMNDRLKKFASDNYKNSKSDLFAMFIERSLELVQKQGQVGMITMQSWMFLSSFENLRTSLLNSHTIISMAHLGARAFDSIGGEVVSTTSFIIEQNHNPQHKGTFLRLVDGNSEIEKNNFLLGLIKGNDSENIFKPTIDDFHKIPASPIAYWAPQSVFAAFEKGKSLHKLVNARIALATGDNGNFVRCWHEVSFYNIGFGIPSICESIASQKRWFPCNKGGDFRKWYGNNDNIVNWYNDGKELKEFTDTETGRVRSHNYNGDFAFRESVTWSALATGKLGVRYSKSGFKFVTPGSSAFKKSDDVNLYEVQALLSSTVSDYFLRLISATINIEVGNVLRIPVLHPKFDVISTSKEMINIATQDWDSFETSWDFQKNSLLGKGEKQVKNAYSDMRGAWTASTSSMKNLEETNNKAFIKAYDLEDVLSPAVLDCEVTLDCNPHYRYSSDKSEEKLEELLLADTMREFLSYAVGCMFGRYSLDKPGLILANQGDTLETYLKQVPQPSFIPDKENVIPLLEESWFSDDIVDRFHHFLKVTFGEQHFAENLAFIEQAIGKDLRKFFIKDFYTDHLKRYKKRPIYWLFSSPKGSFNALVYLHRYRPDTVSVVLDYLREFSAKLEDEKKRQEQISISATASASEKTKALRQIDKLNKMLEEVNEYERDELFPLATRKLEIDLDDGVKHNYPLFGKALKKVTGLS